MSVQLEHVGREPVSSRELFVLDVPDLGSVGGAPIPARFICLLAWNADGSTLAEISVLAETLLAAGCAYICCWGARCEVVHDIFDEVNAGQGDPRPIVMSTWHAEEPLAEVIRFALFCANPDSAFEPCRTVVGISIANSSWAAEIRDAMRDPAVFDAATRRN